MSRKPTRGRVWAYVGTALGGGVSVAANWAHSFLPTLGASASWSPEPGAIVGAIVWPVFLFIAVEIFARVAWPSGWAWILLRFGGLLPVAGVAAFVSYRHLSGLLAHYGEEAPVVFFGPIAVDGLMLMATGALLAINHRASTVGVAVTPVAVPAATPAAVPVPPVVTQTPRPSPSPVIAVTTVDPVPVAPPTARTPAPAPAQSRVAPAPPLPTSTSAVPAPPAIDTPVTASGAASNPLDVPAGQLARAAHIVKAHRETTGKPMTANELAVKMRVNSTVAGRILSVLELDPSAPTTPMDRHNGATVNASR